MRTLYVWISEARRGPIPAGFSSCLGHYIIFAVCLFLPLTENSHLNSCFLGSVGTLPRSCWLIGTTEHILPFRRPSEIEGAVARTHCSATRWQNPKPWKKGDNTQHSPKIIQEREIDTNEHAQCVTPAGGETANLERLPSNKKIVKVKGIPEFVASLLSQAPSLTLLMQGFIFPINFHVVSWKLQSLKPHWV